MRDVPKELDGEGIAKANVDLAERLLNEGVSIAYDEDGDTLFLTIGEGGEAVSDQMVDGIYFRINPDTLKVVGCVIVAFKSDILANNKLARKLFQEGFEKLRQQGGSVQWDGLQAMKVQPLFELVTTH